MGERRRYAHSMATTVQIDLHYLPSIEYFACLWSHDTIVLEAHGSYPKQTYCNRCYIRASQQIDRLTIPVIHQSTRRRYAEVAIDYTQPWADAHWRALCTSYSKSPYFTYFSDYFQAIYQQQYQSLFDLNLALLKTCLQLLQLDKTLVLSQHYEHMLPPHILDARGTITPQGRTQASRYCHYVPYAQVFGQGFTPNLSVIDLLFCMGNAAVDILQQSATKFT